MEESVRSPGNLLGVRLSWKDFVGLLGIAANVDEDEPLEVRAEKLTVGTNGRTRKFDSLDELVEEEPLDADLYNVHVTLQFMSTAADPLAAFDADPPAPRSISLFASRSGVNWTVAAPGSASTWRTGKYTEIDAYLRRHRGRLSFLKSSWTAYVIGGSGFSLGLMLLAVYLFNLKTILPAGLVGVAGLILLITWLYDFTTDGLIPGFKVTEKGLTTGDILAITGIALSLAGLLLATYQLVVHKGGGGT